MATMRSCNGWLRAVAVIVVAAVTAVGCGGSDGETADRGELRGELVALADDAAVPGWAYAVVGPDGIVEAEGFGLADVAADIEVTVDTLFHIGSTHKAMNALMIATLVDDGTLGWDTPLVQTVPDIAVHPDLTLRHLLTMTGGVTAEVEDDLEEAPPGDDPAEPVLAAVEQFDELGRPGGGFEYSNVSASAAGYAAVLGSSADVVDVHRGYLELLEARVLGALGMDDSTLLISEARATGRMSRSYRLDGGEPTVVESIDSNVDMLAPSGSLKSTVTDMARFLAVFVNDGVSLDGAQVVSPTAIAEMWTPGLGSYAMGWDIAEIDGIEVISHEGSYDDFVSVIAVVPSAELGFVLLTNSEDAGGDLLPEAVERFVASTR